MWLLLCKFVSSKETAQCMAQGNNVTNLSPDDQQKETMNILSDWSSAEYKSHLCSPYVKIHNDTRPDYKRVARNVLAKQNSVN